MINQIKTTPLINTWMNGRRQFWDLWFDGLSPLMEIESKLLHIKGTKEPEDSLRKLTKTILDEQEKMLIGCCENLSKAANQNNGTTGDDTFEFWKKEMKSIGELEKESFQGLSPLLNLYSPQKMLNRMDELTSMMTKGVEVMKQSVGESNPEQTSKSTKPPSDATLKKATTKHKRHATNTH